ncbi:hypothetical protein CBM2637_B110305 [Cupriavidus taiwanensis]|nr:hypothetical protein CBM2637_B110305 [Cupriavidus taiwanensis]
MRALAYQSGLSIVLPLSNIHLTPSIATDGAAAGTTVNNNRPTGGQNGRQDSAQAEGLHRRHGAGASGSGVRRHGGCVGERGTGGDGGPGLLRRTGVRHGHPLPGRPSAARLQAVARLVA